MRQINDLTYEITITTYTYTLSGADRPELEVQWGDKTSSIAPRIQIANLPNDYRRNVYVSEHTFPGPGTYTIVVQDPNRNYGVKNIPNSVNVIFSIKTTISINPQIGLNSTPVLLNPPFDKAGLNQVFIHNPAAFDSDGDSISYSLSVCTQQNGEPIPGYILPIATDTLYVDPVTGDLVWDTPADTGIYNIAMNIHEWRKGIKIGNIVRDMQVEVYRTTNSAPVNELLPSFCIIAGDSLIYKIRSTDENGDYMEHFITGGPLILPVNPAKDSLVTNSPGLTETLLTWHTSCEHVRLQPYSILVKTTDKNNKLSLVDIDNLSIQVLGPSPENISLLPASSSIRVRWNTKDCDNISYYNIYRRTGQGGYIPDSCTYGIPAYAGYQLVGRTSGGSDSIFTDNNHGQGLAQGTEYCYRVVAVYPDGSESIPSDEVCSILVPGSPAILTCSVTNPDALNGSVLIRWAKPLKLEEVPPPYEYVIYRSGELYGTGLTEIQRFITSNTEDTSYLDQGLNTLLFPYSYSVELFVDSAGFKVLFGKPEIASTLYPGISYSDNALNIKFVQNVPWINTEYTVYRENKVTGVYDSLGVSGTDLYTDSGLTNGLEYCYKIRAKGARVLEGNEYLTENISHIACATPLDTLAPCPPYLSVTSKCDSGFNDLSWIVLADTCSQDIVKYTIYFTAELNQKHVILDSTEETNYRHFPETSLAGCYYVTATDSFGNESLPSLNICNDECISYDIPNVFSPDGDGINDILYPFPYQFVDRIDLKIFNRWGQLIFQTEDPDINWDGKIHNTSQIAATGVYYYLCDVYEKRLTGTEVRNIVGFIHVYSDKDDNNSEK